MILLTLGWWLSVGVEDWGAKGIPPALHTHFPQIWETYFSGKYHVKIRLFFGGGKYRVEFGHFVDFSCIQCESKNPPPRNFLTLFSQTVGNF